MKNLIQFATRIDKDLKERVIEFSKEKNVSVQKIIEDSLIKTLNDENYGKSETSIFLESKVSLYKNEGYFKAEQLIVELDDFFAANNIKLPEEIECNLLDYLEIKTKVDNAIDLYSVIK